MSYEIPSNILEIIDELVRKANSGRKEQPLVSREDVLMRALMLIREEDAQSRDDDFRVDNYVL